MLSELFGESAVKPFAMSGTSGGAIGVATYLAKYEPLGASDDPGGVGIADLDDPDFLSSLLRRWFVQDILFHELLRTDFRSLLFGDEVHQDRAVALAVDLSDEIPPLREPFGYGSDGPGFQPIAIFNTGSLLDGCLAPISTLSDLAGPALSPGPELSRPGPSQHRRRRGRPIRRGDRRPPRRLLRSRLCQRGGGFGAVPVCGTGGTAAPLHRAW